jgi:hypothetical protein
MSLQGTDSLDPRSCGCWYAARDDYGSAIRQYLPRAELAAHATIMMAASKTVLTQKFVNPSTQAVIQAHYTFPLYDGVSVVGFKCRTSTTVIHGLVREKKKARADYNEAVSRGETAGLLEQLPEASDVFTTCIGNIPPAETAIVEITYLGELKHDAEVEGVRFMIPTVIAPRYGVVKSSLPSLSSEAVSPNNGIEITVDVTVDEGSFIHGIQSPTHPIAVTLGRSSTEDFAVSHAVSHRASATLCLRRAKLEIDFVLLVLVMNQDNPRAMLERHPRYMNQRALMVTLVPKFYLPSIKPEIVFVFDRSGSMGGKISILVAALKELLNVLPVGVKFNICSFGTSFSFLWNRSQSYTKQNLDHALKHVETFQANLGGTEMLCPVQKVVENRYKDMELNVLMLTDGQIWDQQNLFDFINESVRNDPIKFFSLGIGPTASSSLIEGIARAGNGFAQSVGEGEKLDQKMVTMLKASLTPHMKNFSLKVKYDSEEGENVTGSLRVAVTDPETTHEDAGSTGPISFFDSSIRVEDVYESGESCYMHLPALAEPKLLQAPHKIPQLYSFVRTGVYLLMSPESCQRTPVAVVLRATSRHGPLELEIPIQDVGNGEMIHQLAAKKAVGELEEGRGWIVDATDTNGKKLKERFEGRWDEIVEKEAVRLAVKYQIGGKWCSFVATEKTNAQLEEEKALSAYSWLDGDDWDSLDELHSLQRSNSAWTDSGATPAPQYNNLGSSQSATSTPPSYSAAVTQQAGSQSTGPLESLQQMAHSGLFPSGSSNPWLSVNGYFNAPPTIAVAQQTGSQSTASLESPQQMTHSGLFPPGSSNPWLSANGYFNAPPNTAAASQNSATYGFPCAPYQYFASSSPHLVAGSSAQPSSIGGFGALQNYALGVSDGSVQKSVVSPRHERSFSTTNAASVKQPSITAHTRSDSLPVFSSPTRQRYEYNNHYHRLHRIILLQTFDGSWKWTEEFFEALGIKSADVDMDRIHSEYSNSSACTSGDTGMAVATLLAIAFLKFKKNRENETWELVVQKGRRWLESAGMTSANIETAVEKLGRMYFSGA